MTKKPVFGAPVFDWSEPPVPCGEVLTGRYCQLEKLNADSHAALLFRAYQGQDQVWDYLPYGPFSASSQYHRWMKEATSANDPYFVAIKDLKSGQYTGVASYLRIKAATGSIEVGSINFAPIMQRTRAATETMYLMMKWAFEAGYRRYEWKCDGLNLPSRRAAQRLGFSYEGIFRQAIVYKNRNRDTAWFGIIDKEWPALEEAFKFWLAPSNFDSAGRQKESLADLTRLVRVASDPLV